MSQPTTAPRTSRTRKVVFFSAVVLAALIALLFFAANVITDVLWYRQAGYSSVLFTQWWLVGGMFAAGFIGMAVPLWLCVFLARRSRPTYVRVSEAISRYQQILAPLQGLVQWGVPAVFGVFAGVIAAGGWQSAALWWSGGSVGQQDPQFGVDAGFYMFQLPFLTQVLSFALAVVLISGVVLVALSYLQGSIRVEQRTLRIAKGVRVQLAVTAAVYLVLQAARVWLERYQTLTDSQGIITGATYADANAVIPGRAIIVAVALLVAATFVSAAISGRWRVPIAATAVLVVSSIAVGTVYPWVIQTFQVSPSERNLEAQYIQRNIDATRAAYGVADVQEVPYDATTSAQSGALRADAETTASIRLLDPALVSDTFRELQQYKQYYQFNTTLDVDRYQINGASQDTVLAIRELSQQASDGWYNNAVVYTHGYGIVAAYGNQHTSDGKPVFLESGIPVSGELGDYEPRVYFGEKSPAYSIVGGNGQNNLELDYPATSQAAGSTDDATAADSGQTYTTFEGDGGPRLDNFFVRLLYAIKFGAQEILTSNAVNSDSQILYNRSPVDRVKMAAPYLTIDGDPYPAVVDGRIQWVIDGYTTSANYPYSEKQSYSQAIADSSQSTVSQAARSVAGDDVNYIRNSVKATVDAYDGSIKLYAWDANDAVLQAWQKVFPSTVLPQSEMSAQLMEHIRYPTDLFKAQRSVLSTYHVTDAGSFYSSEDAWQVPNDPQNAQANQKQPPYYLTMRLPQAEQASFSLYTSFVPAQQGSTAGRNVLTGYLAADGDAGDQAGVKADTYGKLTLLTLPRETTVPGPGQMQNNFDTNSDVSTELNLLRQGQSSVESGNLLTLPVGGGLLYVQPVYVRSAGNTSYPLLRKVLVAFGDQIAFEDTLEAALDQVFGGDSGAQLPGDGGTGEQQSNGNESGNGGETSDSGQAGGTTNASVQQALQDAKQALSDREAARVAGDWSKFGEADSRLQQALQRAIDAEQQ